MTARIVVIGGGAIAHALCAVLGASGSNAITAVSRHPDAWSNCVFAYYDSVVIAGGIAPTNDFAVVRGADLVLVAAPAFAHRALVEQMRPYLDSASWIGALPAVGGFDMLVQSVLPEHERVLGSLRSPYNARVIEYGRSVNITGIIPRLDLVTMNPVQCPEAARLVQQLLGIPVRGLSPFVLASISPGSTIFHPARLLELLDQPDPAAQRFYGDWGEVAASHYLAMDGDLTRLRVALGCDIDGIDAAGHYGIVSAQELASRIRTLPGLPDIPPPFGRDGYLDAEHRFVREDLQYGIAIAIELARTVSVAVPALTRGHLRLSAARPAAPDLATVPARVQP